MKCWSVFILLMLLGGLSPAAADIFGSSGGLRNEGDRSVKVKVVYANGAYEWVRLPRGASLDLPEGARSVLLADDDESQHLFEPRDRMRVAVIHPGGEREEITELGKVLNLNAHPLRPALREEIQLRPLMEAAENQGRQDQQKG